MTRHCESTHGEHRQRCEISSNLCAVAIVAPRGMPADILWRSADLGDMAGDRLTPS